jgi:hypothetical protein
VVGDSRLVNRLSAPKCRYGATHHQVAPLQADDRLVTVPPGSRRFVANIRWERAWGPGSITIDGDGVTVAGLRRSESLHPSTVAIDTAILWAPWANVYVRLVDEERTEPPVAAVPLWMRKTVVTALRQAGYHVRTTRHLLPSADRLP